ncbi:MAG: alpha/beta hydrolase [Pseudomonadota bacterium]
MTTPLPNLTEHETKRSTMVVDGTELLIEGEGTHTVVMLHGWPDTQRLWDNTVQALSPSLRCVRFTLPGFGAQQAGPAIRLDGMTQHLLAILDAVSPDQPVTLLLHDWGCIFGYELAMRHPQRVARLIGVDIGDHNMPAYLRSLSAGKKMAILLYQLLLAQAWVLGRYVNQALANGISRWMARAMRCPTPADQIGWQMNYPYAMAWFKLGGGLPTRQVVPKCPMLYLYGKRKPFMFHSPEWLQTLQSKPGSAAHGLATGHWLMVEQPQVFNDLVLTWLQEATAATRQSIPQTV